MAGEEVWLEPLKLVRNFQGIDYNCILQPNLQYKYESITNNIEEVGQRQLYSDVLSKRTSTHAKGFNSIVAVYIIYFSSSCNKCRAYI